MVLMELSAMCVYNKNDNVNDGKGRQDVLQIARFR